MISDCYPPRVGGIESQVRDLGMRLVAAGHEVEVLTATNGAGGARGGDVEIVDGITVRRLGARIPFGLPVNPGAKDHLRARLADGGFDVAHVHVGVVSPFAFDGGDVAVELGIPLAVTWHCVLGAWAPVVRRLGHAERWAAAGAAMHGVSEMAAAQVRELAPRAEVTVLHNGIDTAQWRDDGGGDGAHTADPQAPLKVVLAMRFTPRKRPLAVIDLVRRAREEAPVTLEICGGGPLLGLTRRVVARRGWDDWVSLPGRIERRQLIEHYRQADAYLASSRFESFGIAALEGRTVGLPVIALRGSGAEDFVTDGLTGLVREGDDGLITGIVELAKDRELLQRLRSHNEQVPPTQDWHQIVRDVETEYLRARGEPVTRDMVNHWDVAVEAVDVGGTVVAAFPLDHGADPVAVLSERGWTVGRGIEVRQHEATVTIVLEVSHTDAAGASAREFEDVPIEVGLTSEEVAAATTRQRIAAYALVETDRGLLLTELSDRTWRPGEWTLPGGGVDPGESPLEAVHREVWEETDQRLTDVEFLGVRTSHWIGRAPGGRIEDFHAVRLYYRAHCPAPSDPIVHDVGGSTASAAWVTRTTLEATPLASSVVPALAQWFL